MKYTLNDIVYGLDSEGDTFSNVISARKLLTILNELAEGQEKLKGKDFEWCEMCPRENGGLIYGKYTCPNHLPDSSKETTSPKETWEERFDEKRRTTWRYLDVGNEHTVQIKDFIRAEKEASRKEAIKELSSWWNEGTHTVKDLLTRLEKNHE